MATGRPRFPQTAGVYDDRNEREFRRLVEMFWPEATAASEDDGLCHCHFEYNGGTTTDPQLLTVNGGDSATIAELLIDGGLSDS